MVRFAAHLCAALLTLFSAASAAELTFQTVAGHGGLPLNVAVGGNEKGPPILFIHGMGMSYLSFAPQYQSDLAKDFRIVAMDLRGHGNSGKPWKREDVQDSGIWADDVAAVIAAADLKKPVVVAWSFGGFVIADYVRKYGTEKLGGINFVGTIAGLVPQPPPVGAMSPEDLKRRMALQTGGDIRGNLQNIEATTKLFEFPGITPEYRQEMYLMGVMVPAYFRKAFMGRNLDHQDVTPKLTLPLLVTMGSHDVAQSADAFARLQAALPKATYAVYDGVGHLPFAQDPARFNRELAAFAKTAQAP
ncbi:MAG: alpha/beta hydrolase [Rhodospirillaceae bacterium]|nr:alpha/beta hydrolase [Rhodospirillaceae bacterium]